MEVNQVEIKMEEVEVIEEVKSVPRRSCLKHKSAESEMKKPKIDPRRISLSNTDDVCAICSSPLNNCAVCSKHRETNAVGGPTRKAMRKNEDACNCKCKCHNKDDTNTEFYEAPVVPKEEDADELEREMVLHRLEWQTNNKIANAQREILLKLITRRAHFHQERKQYRNLQKLKDVLAWGKIEGDAWDICQQPDWITDAEENLGETPSDTLEKEMKIFFDEREWKFIEHKYNNDQWNNRIEGLITNKIHTIEGQGCPTMQCDVDCLYFAMAKERLDIILQGRVMRLGKATCDSIFPGQEISDILQIDPLLDNLSAQQQSQLGDLVRNEFGDRGEIDIVRFIHLFDRLCGEAVVDGEFRCGTTSGEAVDEDEHEAFVYDVNYLNKTFFELAGTGENTRTNYGLNRAELKKSLKQGLLLPRAGGVKGFTLPVAGSSAGM